MAQDENPDQCPVCEGPMRDWSYTTPDLWQTIDAAPTDGTWFLAYQRGSDPQFFTCASHLGKWTRDEDYRDQPPEPTHWQPLPEAPK